MIETGGASVVRLGAGRMFEMEERYAAGPERCAVLAAVEHREPESVVVKGGEPVEVADLESDRANMQRRAACKGGRRGRIGCVHIGQYWRFGGPAQCPMTGSERFAMSRLEPGRALKPWMFLRRLRP